MEQGRHGQRPLVEFCARQVPQSSLVHPAGLHWQHEVDRVPNNEGAHTSDEPATCPQFSRKQSTVEVHGIAPARRHASSCAFTATTLRER